jgi:hypothetical protein
MEYEIINEASSENLVSCVNVWIKEGYRPIGGVSVSIGEDGNQVFTQALLLNHEA